ncbi:MAG TPA: Xaa-Pro peptidase family protein [Streptosporangiaceae bacterium]|nr:Xaa-Pro peptidase family protein [Streptosporangiaceae bacterium]
MSDVHAARRRAAQGKVAEAGADAALITSPPNVRYLSGLVSSNAAVLVPADGQAILATDSRYAGAAARDCADLELVIERALEPALAAVAAGRGWRRLAFEAQEMTVERYEALAGLADPLIPLGHVVEELRMVKDETEIGLLATACAITSAAFEGLLASIAPGVTERELAVRLERAMVDLGAEGVAFDTIVASGPNGAIPHHSPTGRAVEPGDLITVDCGARYQGYHADMTRTVALGEPAPWQRDIYDLVAAAQLAGVAAAVPGADIGDVDASARDMINAAGHGEHFQHGLGHGVGLEVHEAPIMGYGRTGRLMDRVPVTVEPGVYLPGMGGVRIEDTLVVRASPAQAGNGQAGTGTAGPAQILTTTTRELLVL